MFRPRGGAAKPPGLPRQRKERFYGHPKTAGRRVALRRGGGGSGAGSINIFYANSITKGTITATGGAAGLGTRNGESANAGTGGDGSITIGSISTESFVATK